MVQPTVLKRKHNLKGQSILPVLRRLKSEDGNHIKTLARVSSLRRTEVMSLDEVTKAVKDVTGESAAELLELAGKERGDEVSARLLLHFCIIHANEKGQPEGQDLVHQEESDADEPTPSTSNAGAGQDGKAVEGQSDVANKRRKLEDVEKRISKLEKDSAGSEGQIQQVKEKIKALCTQPQPSEALILLSLDELSRLARKVGHEDMDLFEELFRQCGRMQGKINMGNLCLTVLGGKGADTVTKAINKCLKDSMGSEGKVEKGRNIKEEAQQPKQESLLANLYPPMPFCPMGFQPYPYMMSQFGGAYRSGRPQGQIFKPYRKQNVGRGACLFCESTSHYVKDCELMKQAKRK